jgi:hypothetical protein
VLSPARRPVLQEYRLEERIRRPIEASPIRQLAQVLAPKKQHPPGAERQRGLRLAARNNALALGGPVEIPGGLRAAALQRAMALDTGGDEDRLTVAAERLSREQDPRSSGPALRELSHGAMILEGARDAVLLED